MFMRAARTLSMPELLQVLGEKLDEEYSAMREIPLSFALSAGSLEPEVCCPVGYIHEAAGPDGAGEPLIRSRISKPERTIS
jgi:hypothetical protein